MLVASPDYLAKAGTPVVPADLAGHSVIIGPSRIGPRGWVFKRGSRSAAIRVEGRLTVSVNEGATAAAIAGLGITATGTLGYMAEIESGKLVQLLPDWTLEPVEVNAVFPAGRAAKPSARAFAEYLANAMRQ